MDNIITSREILETLQEAEEFEARGEYGLSYLKGYLMELAKVLKYYEDKEGGK